MIVKKMIKKKVIIKKLVPNRERIATGIKNFDSLIEGGFEKNSTNLIVGSSGSGKSIFAVQFLIEGMEKGETCLYITFEEGKDEFYSNMLDFGWDLEKYEEEGRFFFLVYTPEKVKTMLEEGGGTIESVVLTKKIKRIVIDSITSFELLFEKELEKRESALSLFSMLSKWDCTSLLTYEGTPSPEKKVTSRVLDFESDAIILLYFIRERKQRVRYLEVLKMRGTKHSLSIYPFTIEKTGITVSDKTYEGELK
jgi:circadian clock protein KaiC